MRKHIAITLCIFLSCTSIVVAEEKISNQEQTSIALDILRMYIDSSVYVARLKSGLTYDLLGLLCGMDMSNVQRNQEIGIRIL
jgi:hypothetical protein